MNGETAQVFAEEQSINWESLKSRCIGRLDLVQKALSRFQEHLVGDLEALEIAAESRNCEEIARIAHRIKGTSLTVSADRLAEFAMDLEQKAEKHEDAMDDSLSEIREECCRLSEAIEQQIAKEI
ncbi:hypothetical protein GC197_04125 [bacterium]|nr:hypothetical protein [bacterium]